MPQFDQLKQPLQDNCRIVVPTMPIEELRKSLEFKASIVESQAQKHFKRPKDMEEYFLRNIKFRIKSDQKIKQCICDIITKINVPDSLNNVPGNMNVRNSMLSNNFDSAGYISNAVDFGLVYFKTKFVKGGKWIGKNGKAYSLTSKFYGNKYTGSRNNILSKANRLTRLGGGICAFSLGLSSYNMFNAIKEGDTLGAVKSGLDIAVTVIATFGGPVGWTIGAIYLTTNIAIDLLTSQEFKEAIHIGSIHMQEFERISGHRFYSGPKY